MPDEKQLISSYLEGDPGAFEALVSLYLKPVYGFVFSLVGSRQEAEDIAQETFLRVWKTFKRNIFNRRGYDPKKASFKTWIFAIARNAAVDYLRKRKIPVFSQFENAEGESFLNLIPDSSLLPEEILRQKNAAEIISGALKKISPQNREMLTLYYNDRFKFREIAQILGESLDTVKSRHRRALIALRKMLSNEAKNQTSP